MSKVKINANYLLISIVTGLICSISIVFGMNMLLMMLRFLRPGDPCLALVPWQGGQGNLDAYYACRDALGLDEPFFGKLPSLLFVGIVETVTTGLILIPVTYSVISKLSILNKRKV